MAEPQNAGEVRVALTLNLKDLKGQLDVGATNLKGYRLPIGVSLIVSAESAKDLQRDFNALHTAPVKVPVEFVYPSGGPQSGPQSGPQAPSGGPGPPGVDWSSRPYRPPKPVPDGGTVRAKPEAPAPPGAPPRTAPQPRDASGRWSRVIGKPTDVQDSPTNQPISGQPPRPTTARGGTQGGRVTLSDAERQAEDQRAYLYGLQRTVPVGQPPASRPWSGVVGRFTTSPHPDYAPEMDRWVRPPSRGPQPTRSRGTVKVGGGVGPWPRQGRDPIETGETLAAISARTDAEIAARPGSGHGVRAGGFGTPQDRRATPAQQAWRQREIDNINAINAPLAGQIEPERRAAEAKARQEAPDSELFSEAYAAARTGNLGPLRALDPTQAAMLEAYGGMAGDPSRVQAATTAIRRGYANPSGEPLTEKTGRRARRRSRQFGRLLDPRKNTAGPRAVFDEGDIETGVRFGPTGPLAAVAAAGIMPVVRHTAAENILGMAEASFADTERELREEGIRGKALREHPDWLAAKAALAEARQALGDLLPKAGRAGGGPLSDTGMEYLLSGVTKKTFDERRIRQSRRDSSLPSWGDAWASMDMRGTGPEKVKEYRRRGLIAPWESTFGEGELEPVRAGVSPPLLRQFKKADGGPLTKRLMAARIQKSMDEGDTEKSQRLQLELETMLGGWPAAGIASPWVQMAKRGKLPPKVSGRVGGGLLDRLKGKSTQQALSGIFKNAAVDVDDFAIHDFERQAIVGNARALAGMFPETAGAIQGFKLDSDLPLGTGLFGESGRPGVGAPGTISIHPLAGNIARSMNRDTSAQVFSDIGGVVAHEFGHALSTLHGWRASNIADKRSKRAAWKSASADPFSPSPSSYGEKGTEERYAEWFALSTLQDKDRLAAADPQQAELMRRYFRALSHKEGGTGFGPLPFKRGGGATAGGDGVSSSLHDLPRVAANAVDITEVGERGREALVTMRGGGQFVVPNHQLAAFKGMVGMADGGLTNRRPGKKGLQIIGSGGGTFDERRTRATMEGLATGTAASTSIASNDIQRVHVVNWPAELGGSGTGSADVLTPARTRRERTAATSAAAAAAAAVDPTRVASAGTASRRFTLPRATASQKFASRQAGEAAIMGLQQDPNIDPITELRAQISEELSLVPVRALSVAVGQQFQQLFGGRAGILKQARRAAASTNVAAKAEARLAALDTQKEDLRTRARDLRNLPSFQRKSPEEQAEIRQGIAMELRDIRATENTARGDYFKKLAVAQQDVEKIATPAQRLRAGAVGVGGVVIGTLLFTTAMKVVQGGLELLGKAIDPAVDEILGFGQTVKRVSDELSQSVRAGGTGGRAEIAGVQAAFGLGIETPALVKRSQFLAGAQDFQQVQDTIRAEVNLRSRPSLQGITTGFGNGILPGTPLDWINQTPGLTEQIIGTVGPRPVNTEVDEQAARLERNAMVWDQINANIAKVNPSPGKFVTGLVAADPRIKATSEAIRQFSGGGPMADLMEQFGTGFVGPKGEMPTVTRNMFGDIISSTVTDAFEAALRGQAVSDPGKLFGSMRPQLQAQIDTTRRMAEFQRDTMLPSEFTMQQLAHPLSRNLMQGILPPSNAGFGGFGGVGGALSPNIARQLGAARGAVGAQAALGIQPLIDLGLSRTDIAEVRDLGREIRDMQDAAENMQLAQEATLYNRQLFITRRTLGDIVGLQGRSSTSAGGQVVAATELGQLQRAQLVDSREAARIGLARNQREINLQLALSRLQAPGETPEERAVRRREAELVAREEQKMLDINRRTTTRGFRIEDIGIDRSAQDAIFALQELQRQRQLTIDIRGIAQVVEAKQTMLGFLTSSKGIITSVGSKIAEMGIDTLGQIQGQVVELTDTFIKMVDDEFTILQKRADDLFKTGSKREGPNVSESDRGPSAGGTKIKGAQGFIGMTMGPTGFLAGEANREGVIVIRNPKVGSLSGRGGAANININFGNISVRDERDIDALAEKVVKRLHREAAIVGLS